MAVEGFRLSLCPILGAPTTYRVVGVSHGMEPVVADAGGFFAWTPDDTALFRLWHEDESDREAVERDLLRRQVALLDGWRDLLTRLVARADDDGVAWPPFTPEDGDLPWAEAALAQLSADSVVSPVLNADHQVVRVRSFAARLRDELP